MRYECGHDACDICGRRRCDPDTKRMANYGVVLACDPCVDRAINFTLGIAQQWGGNVIDLAKPCSRRTQETSK